MMKRLKKKKKLGFPKHIPQTKSITIILPDGKTKKIPTYGVKNNIVVIDNGVNVCQYIEIANRNMDLDRKNPYYFERPDNVKDLLLRNKEFVRDQKICKEIYDIKDLDKKYYGLMRMAEIKIKWLKQGYVLDIDENIGLKPAENIVQLGMIHDKLGRGKGLFFIYGVRVGTHDSKIRQYFDHIEKNSLYIRYKKSPRGKSIDPITEEKIKNRARQVFELCKKSENATAIRMVDDDVNKRSDGSPIYSESTYRRKKLKEWGIVKK